MRRYRSYLLRLWADGENNDCRMMIESIGSGERTLLPNLQSLVDFLRQQTQVEKTQTVAHSEPPVTR